MAEGQDHAARISEIRGIHVVGGGKRSDSCAHCYTQWPCDEAYVVARLDALAAEASDVARENEALIEEVRAAGEQIAALTAERDELRSAGLRLIEVRDRAVVGADHAFAERDAAVARAERAESERDVYRDALTLISRGVWTARNSVESIVWGARKALRDGAALAAASEGE